jgi:hypothetical protein
MTRFRRFRTDHGLKNDVQIGLGHCGGAASHPVPNPEPWMGLRMCVCECMRVSTAVPLHSLCVPPLLWQSSCRVVGVRRRIATASVVLWQHAALQKALKKHIQVDSNELAVASMANSEDDLAGARPPPTKSAPSSLQAATRPTKRSGLGIDIPGMCTAFGCRLWHASPVRVVYVAFRRSGDDLLPQMPPASRRTR